MAQAGDYADANPFCFSTKPFDPVTGLGDWGRRFYDPRLGRWLTRDPLGYLDGVNLYAYVRGLPTMLVDPFGLAKILVIKSDYDTSRTPDRTKGHAWLRVFESEDPINLQNNPDNAPHDYGLWPDFNDHVPDNGKGNDIRVDVESSIQASANATRHKELTDEQYEKFKALVEEDKTWSYDYNCAAWATEVWEEVTGEKLNARDAFVALKPTPFRLNHYSRQRGAS